MSALMPGAGQIYAGYAGTGLGFLALESTLAVATTIDAVEWVVGADGGDSTEGWVLALCGVHLWNVADAVHRAKKHNEAARAGGEALLSPRCRRGFRVGLTPALESQERGLSVSAQFRF